MSPGKGIGSFFFIVFTGVSTFIIPKKSFLGGEEGVHRAPLARGLQENNVFGAPLLLQHASGETHATIEVSLFF